MFSVQRVWTSQDTLVHGRNFRIITRHHPPPTKKTPPTYPLPVDALSTSLGCLLRTVTNTQSNNIIYRIISKAVAQATNRRRSTKNFVKSVEIVMYISTQRLSYFTPLSTIFKLHYNGQFYWWGKLEYSEKTIDLLQVTDKLYHIILYQVNLTTSVMRTQQRQW